MDVWLMPGAYISVNSPTKVTMVAAAAGEQPAPGVIVIPPLSPLPAAVALIRAAEAANQVVADQAAQAAQAIQSAPASQPTEAPPWSVTFSEKR